MQNLLQLQKGSKNFIEILGTSFADSCSNFGTVITNADVISAIKRSTFGTLSTHLDLQCRGDKSHTYQLKSCLSKTFLYLWKRQKYYILFDIKNVTLHFVDLERSLKRPLTPKMLCAD